MPNTFWSWKNPAIFSSIKNCTFWVTRFEFYSKICKLLLILGDGLNLALFKKNWYLIKFWLYHIGLWLFWQGVSYSLEAWNNSHAKQLEKFYRLKFSLDVIIYENHLEHVAKNVKSMFLKGNVHKQHWLIFSIFLKIYKSFSPKWTGLVYK